MRQMIAKLLLFFAVIGNLAPLALAAASEPLHACCVRAHHCHDSLALEAGQLDIRDASCCKADCCRAITTAQRAHAQPPIATGFTQNIEAYLGWSTSILPKLDVSRSESCRAPPLSSIA
ncbi:MAG: hypothetical protein WB660_24590 [Candidatus Sulfotelmatobacter sp.]